MEYKEDFEQWFLSIDSNRCDLEHLAVGRATGTYWFTLTKAMYLQFCELKELRRKYERFD